MPRTPQRPGLRLIRPLRDFLATEVAGGVLVLAAAAVALVWANSAWSAAYDTFWTTKVQVSIGSWSEALDVRHIVNDGLMAVFFFVVGMEIKRELVDGELRGRKRAALPVAAALGGMTVPALLYLIVTAGSGARSGWGIPMATDIAMALGVLRIAAPKAHPSATLFLLALAIVDDIGAIAVIAIFYSDKLAPQYLIGALIVVLALASIGRRRPIPIGIAAVAGVAAWYLTLRSGVHATIAGVVLGLLTPARPHLHNDMVDAEALLDVSSVESVRETLAIARSSVSTLEWLEHLLHPWTSFVIVPLFALANAGIVLDGDAIAAAVRSPVAVGVFVGLVAGKVLGIVGATWLAVRFGIGELPSGLRWRGVVAVASLGGIGFTVSMFVASLAFTGSESTAYASDAKIGILAATCTAAIVGSILARRSLQQIDR